jgi:hypothetical protein
MKSDYELMCHFSRWFEQCDGDDAGDLPEGISQEEEERLNEILMDADQALKDLDLNDSVNAELFAKHICALDPEFQKLPWSSLVLLHKLLLEWKATRALI